MIECDDGVRLSAIFNRSGPIKSKQLVILIHGWEGSAESTYILSMASRLLNHGMDVIRLNLRDHGDSHALNEGLFNSTLIDEVISAVSTIQLDLDYDQMSLVGFSLGGNFALRVAAFANDSKLSLKRVIAFCPLIKAKSCDEALKEARNYLYDQYFVRKWKRSLRKKLIHFPDYQYQSELHDLKTLEEMNQALIPKYTDYQVVDDYFAAYAISGDVLSETLCPCDLHFSRDDMIIPWQDIDSLADNPNLNVYISDEGGHCGFLKNWKLESWQDDRVIELLS